MYKMLIVDDDPWVLDGIESLIDWKSIDIKIEGAFKNGLDVLNFINAHEKNYIDIILADIRMPGLDGLELLNELKRKSPQTRSIILSGHRDFEYAKKAIHLGVFEYLVKPVGKEILVESLSLLIKHIKENAESEPVNQENEYSPIVNMAIDYINEHIFKKISLNTVAQDIFVNASYLSSIFHEETGENFKYFITREKIEKAKQLLEEKPYLKVYEICEMLSYIDVDNFSKNFKKYTGMTPSQYKKS